MRKKWVMSLVLCGLMVALTGCSMVKPAAKQGEGDGKTAASDETAPDYPILGQPDMEGYEGFSYIYSETLMTASEQNQETGKMEKSVMTVYVPISDSNYVNQNTVYAEKLGVEVYAELEPYMQDEQEDYLPTENLDAYIASYYDPFYSVEFEDLIISGAEAIGQNAARATVEYCEYDNYKKGYDTVLVTCYYAELENENNIFVQIAVRANETTGKTPALLEELEKYYQFDIDWDADRAAKKKEACIAAEKENKFSTGYLLFSLPENWEEEDDSSYDYHVYSTYNEDDAAFIFMLYHYVGLDVSIDEIAKEPEMLTETMSQIVGGAVKNISTEDYGKTCLGDTIKVSYQIEVEGMKAEAQLYMAVANENMYYILAMKIGENAEDAFAVTEKVLSEAQFNTEY